MSHVTQEELLELFDYKDGDLIWRENRGSNKVKGLPAGHVQKTGYGKIMINYKRYQTHRLVWIYHNGDIPDYLCIDHIDRDPSNNNIRNLRLVTHQENCFNKEHRGTYFRKELGVWRSQIKKGKDTINLGHFKTEEEAREAYLEAKRCLHKIQIRRNIWQEKD